MGQFYPHCGEADHHGADGGSEPGMRLFIDRVAHYNRWDFLIGTSFLNHLQTTGSAKPSISIHRETATPVWCGSMGIRGPGVSRHALWGMGVVRKIPTRQSEIPQLTVLPFAGSLRTMRKVF
jgi:hypothetical protein